MYSGFALIGPQVSAGHPVAGQEFLCWKLLIDNDCVPVTLFEVQDLIELAHRQLQWVDLVGCARIESGPSHGIGMLLFTEAHLECNAGLVISIGNSHRRSPLERKSDSAMLAKELQEYRLTLVSKAQPPVTPSETAVNEDHVCSLCRGSHAECPAGPSPWPTSWARV